MSRKFSIFALCAVLLFAFGCGQKSDQATRNAGSVLKATVSVVIGSATVLRDGVASPLKISVGLQLLPEDMVVTAPASRVNVVLEDSGIIQVGASSRIVMSDLIKKADGASEQKVLVKAGRVILGLKKLQKDSQFDVQTPTAVAGVRGTSFMVSVSEEENSAFPYFVKLEDQKQLTTEIAVLAGAVELSDRSADGKPVMINSLKMAVLQGSDFQNVRIVDIDRLALNELREVKGFAEIQKLQMNEITDEIDSIEPQIKAVLKKDLKTSAETKKAGASDVTVQENQLKDDVQAQDKTIEKAKTKQKREGKYVDDGSAW